MRLLWMALLTFLVSCAPVSNEIWLNSNRSGKIVQTYDLYKSIDIWKKFNLDQEAYDEGEMILNMAKLFSSEKDKEEKLLNLSAMLEDRF